MSDEVNQIVSFIFDSEEALAASTGYKAGDLFKVALIKSTGVLKILVDTAAGTWIGMGGSSNSLQILSGASAGTSSVWLPKAAYPERLAWALDSGSTPTTFSIDISANGITSLSQAFTGSWASSTLAEISPPLLFSDINAKYFRINVLSGGPISFIRGV